MNAAASVRTCGPGCPGRARMRGCPAPARNDCAPARSRRSAGSSEVARRPPGKQRERRLVAEPGPDAGLQLLRRRAGREPRECLLPQPARGREPVEDPLAFRHWPLCGRPRVHVEQRVRGHQRGRRGRCATSRRPARARARRGRPRPARSRPAARFEREAGTQRRRYRSSCAAGLARPACAPARSRSAKSITSGTPSSR